MPGMAAFARHYAVKRIFLVGQQGIPVTKNHLHKIIDRPHHSKLRGLNLLMFEYLELKIFYRFKMLNIPTAQRQSVFSCSCSNYCVTSPHSR